MYLNDKSHKWLMIAIGTYPTGEGKIIFEPEWHHFIPCPSRIKLKEDLGWLIDLSLCLQKCINLLIYFVHFLDRVFILIPIVRWVHKLTYPIVLTSYSLFCVVKALEFLILSEISLLFYHDFSPLETINCMCVFSTALCTT